MTFYNETIARSDYFNSQSRVHELDLLEPTTRAAVEAILAEAKTLDVPLIVFETYRSTKRQDFLFRQGQSQLQKVGVHHYGLAADLVRLVRGQPNWQVDYKFLGPLAKKHGLVWGGDWGNPAKRNSFVDSCHVQRIAVADQERLFNGTWYPDVHYQPFPRAETPTTEGLDEPVSEPTNTEAKL